MFKKLLLAIVALIVTMGVAFAAVDVNKADQAALDGVKGIGPKTSKAIIDERKKGGDFKDWADLEKRVKGIGEKNAIKMSENGLTVNGQSNPQAKAGKNAKADTGKETSHAASGGTGKSTSHAAGGSKEMKKESKPGEAKQ